MPKYKWFYPCDHVQISEYANMKDLAEYIASKENTTRRDWIYDMYMRDAEIPDDDWRWNHIQVRVTPVSFKVEAQIYENVLIKLS